MIRLWLPPRRPHYWRPRSHQPWTPAEDRKLLKAVKRVERRCVEPWQAKPLVDWVAIARRHGRSVVAVQARCSLLRSAPRLAHGIKRMSTR